MPPAIASHIHMAPFIASLPHPLTASAADIIAQADGRWDGHTSAHASHYIPAVSTRHLGRHSTTISCQGGNCTHSFEASFEASFYEPAWNETGWSSLARVN